MNAQRRDIAAAQEARQAELQPFRVEQAQREQGMARNQQRLLNIHQTGQRLKPLLEAGDTDAAQRFLANNILEIQGRVAQGSPENTNDSVEILAKIRQGDIQGALGDINAVAGLVNQAAGRGVSVGQREFDSKVAAVKADPELKTPEGKAAAVSLGIEAKASSSAQERIASDPELAKLIASLESLKTTAKTKAKTTTERQAGFIDAGIEAADSVNNIKRSIELLDTVKTGGFDNASLKAKQFFGIEGADEGELSARLGVSILAQLKPIFGSAFTEREGARLDRISARFGASPETNKRLLNDALVIAERSARRGLAAAKKSGDTFAAEEIQTVLDSFKSINDEVATPTPQSVTQITAQPSAGNADAPELTNGFVEGQTATGPNGQKAVFTNGQWVVQ